MDCKYVAPIYLASPSRVMEEELLSKILHEQLVGRGGKVLDVGCGGGEYRFLFDGQKYTGVDIKDFDFASKRDKYVDFVVADATTLPLTSSSQDFVLCQYAMEFIQNAKQALSEMHRVLRPGGVFYACVPTRWVLLHELPVLFLRLLGRSKNLYLSSRTTNKIFFTQKRLEILMKQAGFENTKCFSTCGPACYLLKMIHSYCRGLRYAMFFLVIKGLQMLNKIFAFNENNYEIAISWCKRQQKDQRRISISNARGWPEYLKIRDQIEASSSIVDIVYAWMIEASIIIDKTIFSFIKIEIGVLTRKPLSEAEPLTTGLKMNALNEVQVGNGK